MQNAEWTRISIQICWLNNFNILTYLQKNKIVLFFIFIYLLCVYIMYREEYNIWCWW